METQSLSVSGVVSLEGLSVCGKVMNARVPSYTLFSFLSATPHLLNWTLVNTLRVRACLTSTTHTMTLSPLHSHPHFNTLHVKVRPRTSHIVTSERGMQGSRWRESQEVSVPSVGMKLRGPGSSGNAEQAVWSSQHSRNRKEGAMVAIATERWSLWK